MLIAIHGVKPYAQCYTMLYMSLTLYAHCHTWSEALCPLLYMELMHME